MGSKAGDEMLAKDPLFILAAGAALAVLVILMIGIGGFAKGGDFNRKHGNRMMRWRLYAQAAALVILMLFLWLRSI